MTNIQKKEQKKATIFRNLYTKEPDYIFVANLLKRVKNGASKSLITQIRCSNEKAKRDLLKKRLPAIAWSGILKGRKHLIAPTGLACLDFDKVQNLSNTKDQLSKSKFIYAIWVSPSGNGLKALIKIPLVKNKVDYKERYNAALHHFKKYIPDNSTSDINRLCFESYDKDLYLNEQSHVFTESIKKPKESSQYLIGTPENTNEGQVIYNLFKWWKNNYSFSEGSRNNNLFILACSLSEFGISKETSLGLLSSFESEDFSKSEINRIVKSAFIKTTFNSKSFV